MKSWSPSETGTDFTLSPILKPLEPFRSHMTIVSGLRNKGGESSDPHGIMAGTWLSCYRHQGPRRRHAAPRPTSWPRGISAATRRMPSLELTGEGGDATCGQGATGCGFGSTIGLPHALPAAADGRQPAQGLLPAVRPGRHQRRSARTSSARPAACSTT